MTIGDRVKPSGYAVRSLFDMYLGCGVGWRKARYKDAYEQECAKRGTVLAVLPATAYRAAGAGLRVRWDDGSVSDSMAYRVEQAEK